jgi:hypothetical protein
MKIIIESTDQLVTIEKDGAQIPGRIWEGYTESGIFVQCLVTRIGAPKQANLEQFDRELKECRPPEVTNVFPLRMII